MFQVSVGSLQHPNIVQTFSTHLVGEELWVLMEPLDGGSLTQIVENLHIAKLVTISPDSQTIALMCVVNLGITPLILPLCYYYSL